MPMNRGSTQCLLGYHFILCITQRSFRRSVTALSGHFSWPPPSLFHPSLPRRCIYLVLSRRSGGRRDTTLARRGRRGASLLLLPPPPLPTNIVNRSPHLHLTLLPRPSISQWQLLTLAIILMGLLHCTRYFKPLHRTTHTRTKVGITATAMLFSSPPFSS